MHQRRPKPSPPTVEEPPSPPARLHRTHDRHAPNPHALGYRVRELRALGGPGLTKAYELIKTGRLQTTKIGATTIVIGDSFRRLMRGEN